MNIDSTPQRRRRFPAEVIDQYLEQFSNSPLSASAFAASQGLHPATFSRWLRCRRSKPQAGSPTRFIEVTPPRVPTMKTEIRFSDGLVIHLPSHLGTDALCELIHRLRKS